GDECERGDHASHRAEEPEQRTRSHDHSEQRQPPFMMKTKLKDLRVELFFENRLRIAALLKAQGQELARGPAKARDELPGIVEITCSDRGEHPVDRTRRVDGEPTQVHELGQADDHSDRTQSEDDITDNTTLRDVVAPSALCLCQPQSLSALGVSRESRRS